MPGSNEEWIQVDTLVPIIVIVHREAIIDRRDSSLHRFNGFQARVGNTPTTGGLQPVNHNTLCGQMGAALVAKRNHVF